MIWEVFVHCADCGDRLRARIDEDGTIDTDGYYTTVVTVEEEKIKDHATRVEDYLDVDLMPGQGMVIWTECDDCFHSSRY